MNNMKQQMTEAMRISSKDFDASNSVIARSKEV